MWSIDLDELDSVVRALDSEGESTTIEAEEDEEGEDLLEVIPEKSGEEGLADLYMPPSEAGSVVSI